ncbi:hypothetical protein FI667_g954, partial [Globisporangium splendens]
MKDPQHPQERDPIQQHILCQNDISEMIGFEREICLKNWTSRRFMDNPNMVTERMAKNVPRLALVPRDQVREYTAVADHQELAVAPRRKKQASPVKQAHYGHERHEIHTVNDEGISGGLPDDGEGDHDDDALTAGGFGQQVQQERQLRLGERFLRMMALMTRLSRLQLDTHGTEPTPLSPQASLAIPSSRTALEKIMQTKEEHHVHPQKCLPLHKAAPSSSSPSKGAAAPLIIPVNPATEPLRPHLTFEISMLLPAPMDTRQSSLQSPIRRKQLRPRCRKRRRRRRRVPRTWETSHATWVPRASADYIHERAEQNFLARSSSSKLMEKFAQLKQVRKSTDMAKSASMPALNHDRKYLYAFPNEHKSSSKALPPRSAIQEHDDDVEDEDDGEDDWRNESTGDSEENDDLGDAASNEFEYEDQREQHFAEPGNNEPPFSSLRSLPTDATSHTYPNEAPRTHFSSITQGIDARQARDEAEQDQSTASSSTAASQLMAPRKRPLYHQPAGISPELKVWLIGSGMFQTKPRHAIR